MWEGGLLAPGSGRPRNMSPWYERQEALDKEIEAERQAEELRERLKAYREKMEAARAAAAAGGDAQSAGAAAEGSAAAGASAGKSAGASVGDAGAASAGAAAGGRAGAPAPQRAPPGASSDDDEDDSLFSTLARPPTPPVPPASSPAPPAKRGNGKKGAKKRGAAAKPAPAEPPIREWSAQRLGEWLRAEGFGEYVRAFERHDMDGGALVETTEEELRTELDMRTLGVRKRLRLAVCRKHPKCTVPANTVGAWSEEQVGEWLAEHELGQHAPRFRKHRVDGAALIEITEEELKDELGVRSVKDRKTFRVQLCEASSDCNILPTEIGSWSESEVADWLQSFGYRQHCRRFAQKGIDGVALLELTEPDLKVRAHARPCATRRRPPATTRVLATALAPLLVRASSPRSDGARPRAAIACSRRTNSACARLGCASASAGACALLTAKYAAPSRASLTSTPRMTAAAQLWPDNDLRPVITTCIITASHQQSSHLAYISPHRAAAVVSVAARSTAGGSVSRSRRSRAPPALRSQSSTTTARLSGLRSVNENAYYKF